MNLATSTEIELYVEEVRQALAHLPETTREELLEDLPEHLAEVLAEGGGSLTERLGAPQAYAAELIASAGVTGAVPGPPARGRRIAELRGRFGDAARRADDRVGPLLGYAKASDFLVLLRPAWWVLRGYLAAMAFAYFFGEQSGPLGLLPRLADNELVALLLLGVFVVGSIWLGSRGRVTRPAGRRMLRAANVFLVLFAVVGFAEMDGGRDDSGYMDVGYVSEFSNVDDLFVYDGQGRLVPNAQIYDQNGQPITLGDAYCVDDSTGEWTDSRQLGYPHCPEDAPFLMATPSGSGSAPAPSGSAVPSPSEPVPSRSADSQGAPGATPSSSG